jgi:hypothetical protein
MRLMFVENRYVTWLWRDVAIGLANDGHQVHWLVQNPLFSVPLGSNHVLPFPAKGNEEHAPALNIPLLNTDRSVRFFGGSEVHYPHYVQAVSKVLDDVQPNVIFGEPTQFHELITISLARERGIPYLFPSSTRYPPERLTFHLYETMETVGGCGQGLSDIEAAELHAAIVERKAVPSYMVASTTGYGRRFVRNFADRLRIFGGWVVGERFATPSPWRKLSLDARRQINLTRWESNACTILPDVLRRKPWVLYAMQMQPESNIDVWGHPWSDQVSIIREAADALYQSGFVLVVKPNPRSKYELSTSLCNLIETHPGIIALSHRSQMSRIFPEAAAVLSVTGTVLIEAVLAGRPVGTLGTHAMSRYPGVTPLARPADIADLLSAVCKGTATVATLAEGRRLLSDIQASSYGATLYDPLTHPELGSAVNLDCVTHAFRHVLSVVAQSHWAAGTGSAPETHSPLT